MTKPKPMLALACLLDLLFVLIFASLLMVDPTSVSTTSSTNSSSSKQLQGQVESLKQERAKLVTRLADLQLKSSQAIKQFKNFEKQYNNQRLTATNSTLETQESKAKVKKLEQQIAHLKQRQQLTSSANIVSLPGLWRGVACQERSSCWSIDMTIPKFSSGQKVPSFTVRYPSLKCSATLYFQRWDEDTAIFKEKVNNGRCINNGTISLTPAGSQKMLFVWEKKRGRPGAIGQLEMNGFIANL